MMQTCEGDRVAGRGISVLAAAVLIGLTQPAAANDALRIALVTGGCIDCHGQSGGGANGVPVIAGTKSRADFIAAMQAFREGKGTPQPTVMDRIARGYTDEEFALMATRFARPN
jgi:sulfide dehydrogenase cytochrome subunit